MISFFKNNYVFTVFCSILTFALSLLSNKISYKRQRKKDRFINFYKAFHSLWDQIHQGRAFNYSHLSLKDQERIIYFFIENSMYAPDEANDYIYTLKTCRLDNFNNNNPEFIKACDDSYNKLVKIIVNKYNNLKKKYR